MLSISQFILIVIVWLHAAIIQTVQILLVSLGVYDHEFLSPLSIQYLSGSLYSLEASQSDDL